MRLTVGPLPPAVYWRRRAIVLTIVLSVIFVFVYACSNGPGDRKEAAQGQPLPARSGPTASGSASASPGASGSPATGSASPGRRSASPPGAAPAGQPTGQTCTDQEMQVTPGVQPVDAPRGGTVQLTIKIKNIGKRTCKRDVGADQQEIRIIQGGGSAKVWSSDDCNPRRGSNLQPFDPGLERSFSVTWNGRTSSKCDGNRAMGPLPPTGEYEVFARLGSKLSSPVTLTLS